MKGKRLLIALVAAGAAFGIVTAVQASIPDGNGVVHACFNTSRAHGSPTGQLRAIDLDRVDGHCADWEGAVDLATPQFVTSQINPTSFMFKGDYPGTVPANWYDTFTCPVGYIATDGFAQPTDQFASSWNFIARSQWNHGEVLNGIPDNVGHYAYTLPVVTNVTISATCTNARVFGLPGPTAPITKALMAQASITQVQAP